MLNSEEGKVEVKEEEMPKKKRVRVKPYKRRTPSGVRRTVIVRGYTRSLPKTGVKIYTPRSKRTKKTAGAKIYTPRRKRRR